MHGWQLRETSILNRLESQGQAVTSRQVLRVPAVELKVFVHCARTGPLGPEVTILGSLAKGDQGEQGAGSASLPPMPQQALQGSGARPSCPVQHWVQRSHNRRLRPTHMAHRSSDCSPPAKLPGPSHITAWSQVRQAPASCSPTCKVGCPPPLGPVTKTTGDLCPPGSVQQGPLTTACQPPPSVKTKADGRVTPLPRQHLQGWFPLCAHSALGAASSWPVTQQQLTAFLGASAQRTDDHAGLCNVHVLLASLSGWLCAAPTRAKADSHL